MVLDYRDLARTQQVRLAEQNDQESLVVRVRGPAPVLILGVARLGIGYSLRHYW